MENLKNLLKVKTIITLSITGLFIYLSINEKIPVDTITLIIVMVFTYYFNKDDKKGVN